MVDSAEEFMTAPDPEPEKKKTSLKEILTGVAFVILLLGFVYIAGATNILQDMATGAAALGPIGHLIFIGLYIFVAMPFGWGYSVVLIAGGYSFGWVAIATAEGGTLVGSTLAYILCKKLLADWVRLKLKGMKPKTQKTLLAIELAIRSGKGGVGMQTGLRVNPVLPFGWTNAVLGMWEVPPTSFICSTMLGCQVDIVLKTNIGVIFSTVGSMSEATPETKKLVQTQLIIQCCVFVVILICGCGYSRWIMKNVMPPEGGEEGEQAGHGKRASVIVDTDDAEISFYETDGNTGEMIMADVSNALYVSGAKSRQGWRHFVSVLFRKRGSVIIQVLPVSVASGIFAWILVFLRKQYGDELYILPEIYHPFVVQVFGIILSFVIVARTKIALNRYFDGINYVHTMSSRWIDAFTSLLGFLRSSYDLHPDGSAKKDACVALGLAMLHWSSIAHALAINTLQVTQLGLDEKIWEERLAVVQPPHHFCLNHEALGIPECPPSPRDREGKEVKNIIHRAKSRGKMMKGAMVGERRVSLEKALTDEEAAKMATSSTMSQGVEKKDVKTKRELVRLGVYGRPHPDEVRRLHGATDKTAIILMWMEEAVSRAQMQGILLTAPPILARVYNEIGNGLMGFNNAYRIALVPFPFCFAQMVGWCLVVFVALCPATAEVFTGGEILTSTLTFCCMCGFWGLNRIAIELENPFGCEVNHLPLAELHHAYIEAIGEMHEHPMPEYEFEYDDMVQEYGPIKRNMIS